MRMNPSHTLPNEAVAHKKNPALNPVRDIYGVDWLRYFNLREHPRFKKVTYVPVSAKTAMCLETRARAPTKRFRNMW